MNKIYSILLVILNFYFIVSNEHKEVKEAKEINDKIKYHNLIMFLDTTEINGPITNAFEAAYCQKCGSLLIPAITVINNFIDNQTNIIKLEKLDEWLIYINTHYDLFLFIPKLITDSNFINKAPAEQETITGFKINPKNNIFRLIDSSILINNQDLKTKILKNSKDNNNEIDINNIKEIFIKGNENSLWNIVLDGHGLYPKNLINKASMPTNITEQIIQNSKSLIAGLPIIKFINLMSFFANSENINVNFLYYLSCFSGGPNLLLPFINTIFTQKSDKQTVIWKSKPNFIIVSGAMTDEVIAPTARETLEACNKNIKLDIGLHNYKLFFDLIEKNSKNKKFTDVQLKEILSAITPIQKWRIDPYGILTIPNVLFPGSEKFMAMPTNDKIFVITDTMATGIIFRDQPLETLDVDNKEAILLYPYYLKLNLNINVKTWAVPPTIISMKPLSALHIIEKIHINITFSDFIQNVFGVIPISTKFFCIKELTLYDDENGLNDKPFKYIKLKNVLIETSQKQPINDNDIEYSIKLIFTEGDKNQIWTNKSFIKNKNRNRVNVAKSHNTKHFLWEVFQNPLINIIANYQHRYLSSDIGLINFKLLKNLLDKEERNLLEWDNPDLEFVTLYYHLTEHYNNFQNLLIQILHNTPEITTIQKIRDLIDFLKFVIMDIIEIEKFISKVSDTNKIKFKKISSKEFEIKQDYQNIIKSLPIYSDIKNMDILLDYIDKLIKENNPEKFKSKELEKIINDISFKENSIYLILELNNTLKEKYDILQSYIKRVSDLPKNRLKPKVSINILKIIEDLSGLLKIINNIQDKLNKISPEDRKFLENKINNHYIKDILNLILDFESITKQIILINNDSNMAELSKTVAKLKDKKDKDEFIKKEIEPLIKKINIK